MIAGVKKLTLQLFDFVRRDFDPVVYGGTAAMLAVLMVLNYEHQAFSFLNKEQRTLRRFLEFAAFYGLPWGAVVALQLGRKRVRLGYREPAGDDPYAAGGLDWHFVRTAGFAIALIACIDWVQWHRDLLQLLPPETHRWARSVLWNLKTTTLYFFPMALFWWVFDRGRPGVSRLYGWTTKGFDFKPYALCLSVVVPLVTWASFQESFLKQYPTYKPWKSGAEEYLGVGDWATVVPYELIYGFDFSFVEMYFRGFLIIGLARWLGRNAILPMVAMYAVLHFGKPLPETLGSIIGGYILGVFALKSRSILGGIMLHLGMAWGMELTAYAQHALRG